MSAKECLSKIGAGAVKLGKSLMLPIAVLPVAGLLLRLGQDDILKLYTDYIVPNIGTLGVWSMEFMPQVFKVIQEAGNAVFSNLPLIFALGVAIGFAKESHGAAVLAAFVGYMIMTSGMKVFDPNSNMGVFGGIIIGVTAGFLYNRYKDIELPQYLAFFGGRRFVPITMGFTAVIYALVFSLVWPPAERVIKYFGDWIIASGNVGLFAYGFGNRMLIPLGLHHVLNTLVWFQFGDYTAVEAGAQVVKHGDLWRFFSGDPSAGSFMAGFFPVMMFGLPAACLAMITESYKQNRKVVAGIFISAALTSFLTGITEPIEFSFMFLAFPLYVLHAVLTGLSMVIMNLLQVKLGFMFSAGLFDYVINYKLSKNPFLLLPTGIAYGAAYFFVFKYAIRFWDLKTPGREDTAAEKEREIQKKTGVQPAQIPLPVPGNLETPKRQRAMAYLTGLGGKDNIKTLEACATRLRVEVNDNAKIDEALLKSCGARGVVNNIKGSVQVIIGPQADIISDEIKEVIKG